MNSSQNKHRRLFSRLYLRILAINITPVLVLVLGIFYLGSYQNGLIQTELEALERQASLYAGAIAEMSRAANVSMGRNVFRSLGSTGRIIREDIPNRVARGMLRRIGETTDVRIRLFNSAGQIIGDTDRLEGPGGVVMMTPLDDMNDKRSFSEMMDVWLAKTLRWLPSSRLIDVYPALSGPKEGVMVFPNVDPAMEGVVSSNAWWKSDLKEEMLLSAAAPVQNLKQVMGVVYVTKEGTHIHDSINQAKLQILRIFSGVFVLTLVLSAYLTTRIASPLKRLSAAAERVQRTQGTGSGALPDLSKRKDEIGDLSLALRAMTEALEKRLDSIERFAADVAHELKNPLTSLRSAVETASIVKNKEDRDRLMQVILHDVQRLDRLISDISNASRLDAELSREQMGVVDMRSLLQNLVDSVRTPLRRVAVRKGDTDGQEQDSVVLELKEGEDYTVTGIEGRLGQVFRNLINNALSFTDPDKPVEVDAVRLSTKEIAFRVSDKGPGIPETKLNSVFDRFYTERPQEEAFGQHSGLGLSISKQIVEAHGGRIYAENIVNDQGQKTGARFTVILKSVE